MTGGGPMLPGPALFLPMWALMMAAMMLPATAPVAVLYGRLAARPRRARIAGFVGGSLAVWVLAGLPAFLLLRAGRGIIGRHAAAVLAALLVGCGLYQLTAVKQRCLRRCRSPFGLLVRASSRTGRLRDVRAGIEHGSWCLACCWALMALLVGFGAMNVVAMVALAVVVLVEKRWHGGEVFARAVGVAAVGLAGGALWLPAVTPALRGMGV